MFRVSLAKIVMAVMTRVASAAADTVVIDNTNKIAIWILLHHEAYDDVNLLV